MQNWLNQEELYNGGYDRHKELSALAALGFRFLGDLGFFSLNPGLETNPEPKP